MTVRAVSRLNRRHFLALAVPAAAATALVACAQPAPATPSSAGQTSKPAAPAARQELVVAAGLDQHTTTGPKADIGQYPLNENIYEPLVRMNERHELEPLLATKWELRGKTWRFTLRQGVKFHDGQAFNAESVKQTFGRLASSGGNNTPQIGPDSVAVVDDHTVDITPVVPNMRLPEQLVHPLHGMLAPGTDPASKPVGTGPFRYVEYAPGERFVVARFDGYWREKAKLDKITFRFMPDDNTRRLALEAGEADLVLDLARESVATVKSKPGLKVARAPVGANMLMYLNRNGSPGHEHLKDLRVRKAIGHALDTKTLVEKVWEGNAEPGRLMAPAGVLGKHADLVKGFTYDPKQASALLEEAGWKKGADGIRTKDGQPLKITVIGWPAVDRGTYQYVQAQLKEVGLDATVVSSPDNPSYTSRRDSGDFDINIEIPNQNDANPAFLPVLRFRSDAPNKNARYFAPGAKFDELAQQALAAAERDNVQRLSAEMMKLLIDEEAVVIPLAGTFRIYAMKEKVQDFDPHPSQTNQLWDKIWIAS